MARRRRQWLWQWEIRILLLTSPRSRIICARFRVPPYRRSRRSKLCLARSRYTGIFRSAFQLSLRVARESSVRRGLLMEGLKMHNHKLAIKTLLGGVHVSKQADVSDTGLTVYPGSRLKQKDSDGSDKSANVNISGFGFGIKVVALEYESDDTPAKVLSFYKDQLKKYGNVLECHTSKGNWNINTVGPSKDGSNELTCDGSGGDNIELKAGRKDDQHIVAVKP